ncbi:DUF1638 domain-containing protein [Candidatus Poribacteria bacterium]
MKRYHIISCHVLWRELCHFASISQNVFDFRFMKQGLHSNPDILRKELQKAIDEVEDSYSAILIGYGLCSNGLVGITARSKKLVIMKGHDCITFLLGSKEHYREYFDDHPGTYWYSPGWIDSGSMPGKDRYERTLQSYIEKYGKDNAEYLMEQQQGWFQNYSNAAYVDLGFYDTEEFKAYTRECAQWLDWDCDILSGDPRLITDFLEGNWNSEDFLVVEPGEVVVASHDNNVMDIKIPE